MKKIFLIFILINQIIFAADLKCSENKCEVKETISFLGYELYNFKYSKTETEEKIFLTYNIKIEKEKNIEKILEKFYQNNKVSEEDKKKLERWTNETINTFKGATYEVIATKSNSILKINGEEKLIFKDNGDFAKKFFKIWTGENPVDDELKKSILLAKKK